MRKEHLTFSGFKAFQLHSHIWHCLSLSFHCYHYSQSCRAATHTCIPHSPCSALTSAHLAAGALSFSCHHPFCSAATPRWESVSGVHGWTRCEEEAQRQIASATVRLLCFKKVFLQVFCFHDSCDCKEPSIPMSLPLLPSERHPPINTALQPQINDTCYRRALWVVENHRGFIRVHLAKNYW